MTKQPVYEEVLALATALPHEQLAQLVVVLTRHNVIRLVRVESEPLR